MVWSSSVHGSFRVRLGSARCVVGKEDSGLHKAFTTFQETDRHLSLQPLFLKTINSIRLITPALSSFEEEGRIFFGNDYLPAANEPVQLDWIELKPAQGKLERWDF